jgi:hypothetical protein
MGMEKCNICVHMFFRYDKCLFVNCDHYLLVWLDIIYKYQCVWVCVFVCIQVSKSYRILRF